MDITQWADSVKINIISLHPVAKLDGVRPVDNRPSTDKLHHCVQMKKEKKKTVLKCDM